MSKTHDWHVIMDGLSGRRLAVYDDIQHGRKIAHEAPLIQNAMGWLAYHRFIHKDGDQLVARSISAAREIWLREGPAADAGQITNELPERGGSAAPINGVEGRGGEAAPLPAQTAEEPSGPRVTHKPKPLQTELF